MEDGRPWSQSYLGARSGLGSVVIGKIERGERRCLDGNILVRLADALELTTGERREFLLAASGVENAQLSRSGQSKWTALDVLIEMAGQLYAPTYVMDNYCDLMAVNRAVLEILALDAEGLRLPDVMQEPIGLNMLYFVFSPPAVSHFQRLMGSYWLEYARQNILLFRTCTLRYRLEPHFRYLLRELRRYRYFRRYWRDVLFEEKDRFTDNEVLHLNHPRWGELLFFSTTLTAISAEGEIYLCTYVPLSPNTARAFHMATQNGGAMLFRLGSQEKRAS